MADVTKGSLEYIATTFYEVVCQTSFETMFAYHISLCNFYALIVARVDNFYVNFEQCHD